MACPDYHAPKSFSIGDRAGCKRNHRALSESREKTFFLTSPLIGLIERIRGSIMSMELCCFLAHLPELPVERRLADAEQPGRFERPPIRLLEGRQDHRPLHFSHRWKSTGLLNLGQYDWSCRFSSPL